MRNYLTLTVLAVSLWGAMSAIVSSDAQVAVADDVNDVCNQIKAAISNASDVYFPCKRPFDNIEMVPRLSNTSKYSRSLVTSTRQLRSRYWSLGNIKYSAG